MEPTPGQDQTTEPQRRVCVACPRCGQGYRVNSRVLGRRLICRHCRQEWRAAEIRPEDFRSGRLMRDGSSYSDDIELPDDLPVAGSSSSQSLAIDITWAGQTLGRYKVISLLGQGGMAVVWRAHDDSLRRDVALKILSQRRRRDGHGGLDTDLFMQEARAIAKLQHPSVVSIYEVAQDQGQVFLALELMEGGTLQEYVGRFGRIPPRELWSMMIAPAKALALAHRAEIIHRDIKPSNLMFDEHGHLKLMDFGLADVACEEASVRIRGKAVGSFGWIAPETARGQGTTAASDIYSLGLVMLYALRGRQWLHAHSRSEFLALHREPPPLDLSGIKGLTPKGAAVLKTCLAVDPANRYVSAGRLVDALQEAAEESRTEIVKKRSNPASIAAVAAIIGGLAVAIAAWQYFSYLMEQEGQMRQPVATMRTDAARPSPPRVVAPRQLPVAPSPPRVEPAPARPQGPGAQPEVTKPQPKPAAPTADDLRRPWPEVWPDADARFVASVDDLLFHRADSECGRAIFASSVIMFSTPEEARQIGRTPCPKCLPAESNPSPPAMGPDEE